MSLKDELIAAAEVPKGTSKWGDREIEIRGMTADEDIRLAEDGLVKNIIPICASCIVEGDKPVFTEAELVSATKKMKSGILKPILLDIMALSFPKDVEKN